MAGKITLSTDSGKKLVIVAPSSLTNDTVDSIVLASDANTRFLEKAPLASPTFTGAPTAPTPVAGDSSTKVATTSFVNTEIANDVGVANSPLVKTALNASGDAPIYACRAWVNFNGTGTVAIRASGNVSSITDNGTGNYTVNFATAMADANYSATGSVSKGDNNNDGNMVLQLGGNIDTYTTYQTSTSIRGITKVASNTDIKDSHIVTVAIFR